MDQGRVAGAFGQEDDERDGVQACQGFGQALVVAGGPAAARHPGNAALDHPASWQRHEAALGLGQPDHLQGDALGPGLFGRLPAGVALVDVAKREVLIRRVLHRLGQPTNGRTIVVIGRRHLQGRQRAKRVHRPPCSLGPRVRLWPFRPARLPLSGVLRRVRLSSTAAVGSSPRPAAGLSTARTSGASRSKQPARNHRCAWS